MCSYREHTLSLSLLREGADVSRGTVVSSCLGHCDTVVYVCIEELSSVDLQIECSSLKQWAE